jgi:head-tail adaptor
MSFGKMQSKITIMQTVPVKDAEGFATEVRQPLKTVHAYHEVRNATERWVNRAVYSTAACLFRFRKIPHFDVQTTHYILYNKDRYRILSTEDVRGKGMVVECLCEKMEASKA